MILLLAIHRGQRDPGVALVQPQRVRRHRRGLLPLDHGLLVHLEGGPALQQRQGSVELLCVRRHRGGAGRAWKEPASSSRTGSQHVMRSRGDHGFRAMGATQARLLSGLGETPAAPKMTPPKNDHQQPWVWASLQRVLGDRWLPPPGRCGVVGDGSVTKRSLIGELQPLHRNGVGGAVVLSSVNGQVEGQESSGRGPPQPQQSCGCKPSAAGSNCENRTVTIIASNLARSLPACLACHSLWGCRIGCGESCQSRPSLKKPARQHCTEKAKDTPRI